MAVIVDTRPPHFDIYGRQHHRVPFKEKGIFGTQKPLWTHNAKFKTRSEMQQHRYSEKIPHISYDIDGDGVVGSTDAFIARHFDTQIKGHLTANEKAQCTDALKNDFRAKFLMGLEKHGISPYAIQQRRGKIITQDTAFEIGETYPPHYNADVKPPHRTQTEMNEDRRLEKREGAMGLKKEWDGLHPDKVEEQFIPADGTSSEERVTHARQIAQADAEEQRVKCGLYPVNTSTNPEREHMALGLEYVEEPEFQSRSQLLATRKEMLLQDLDANRIEGEERFIPESVRRSTQEAHAFDFRQAQDAKTLTTLEQERKCDRIEYNRAHFGEKMKTLPRYSDHSHPFWLTRCSSAPPGGSKALKDQPFTRTRASKSAPAERKMEPMQPFPMDTAIVERERPRTVGAVSLRPRHTGVAEYTVGDRVVKRWTDDILDRGAQKDAARLFDSLPPAKVVTQDHKPLEYNSSFKQIRNNKLRKVKQKAREDAPISSLWRLRNRDGSPLHKSHSATPMRSVANFPRQQVSEEGATLKSAPSRPTRLKSAPASRFSLKSTVFPIMQSYGQIKALPQAPPERISKTLTRPISAPHLAGIRTTGFTVRPDVSTE